MQQWLDFTNPYIVESEIKYSNELNIALAWTVISKGKVMDLVFTDNTYGQTHIIRTDRT